MVFDVSALLHTIASLSASFVAILGGFIASKLIAINGERYACQSRLNEVHWQKVYHRGVREVLDKALDEEDAIIYIHDHMEEVVLGKSLGEVYAESELQKIDYLALEPLWNRAQFLKNTFDECLNAHGCAFNSDMIPETLAEEYSADLFAYEFLKLYAAWGFSDYFEEEHIFRENKNWYENTRQRALEHTNQLATLDVQEQQNKANLTKLKHPKGMKIGLLIFALFSIFNIILPLSLSIFTYTASANVIISLTAIALLIIGLASTFIYLAWMLKWRKAEEV